MEHVPIEYEAKALDVDREAITALLNSRATLVQPRTLQRRYVYDVVPGDTSTWMRLRQTHTGATLSIKRIEHDGIDGTREWEVAVGDFDTTETMLTFALLSLGQKGSPGRLTWAFRLPRLDSNQQPFG